MQQITETADVLVIGGGTAGHIAAGTAVRHSAAGPPVRGT